MRRIRYYASRLFLRFLLWLDKPLSHEEAMQMFYLGSRHEYTRVVKELGPIMLVKPYPYNTTKPLGIRQRATINRLRRSILVPVPEKESTPPLYEKIDDERLLPTEEMKALSKLLHSRGNKRVF